jgi:hypothetical protein
MGREGKEGRREETGTTSFRTLPPPLAGTQRIRFGRKTDEITKSVTVDEKTKFAFLDEKWMKMFKFLID